MVRALNPLNPKIRVLNPEHTGEDMEPTPIVKSIVETIDPAYDPTKVKLPKFSLQELLGLTFLHDTPNGERVRAQVMKRINDMEGANHTNIKFVIEYGEPSYVEIMS